MAKNDKITQFYIPTEYCLLAISHISYRQLLLIIINYWNGWGWHHLHSLREGYSVV